MQVIKRVRYRGDRKLLYGTTGDDSNGYRYRTAPPKTQSQNQLLNEECPGAI